MEEQRFTPEFITHLEPNEVFVFGSNLGGFHGGGAAAIALKKFGAVWGQGVGLQGQSYGITHFAVAKAHSIWKNHEECNEDLNYGQEFDVLL